MTLRDFILSRVAEDEAVARAVIARYAPDAVTMTREDPWPEEAAFTARYDPTRVLAECEAKRRVVEEYDQAVFDDKAVPHGDNEAGWVADAVLLHSRLMLRIHAATYADHSHYRDEWELT